VNGHPDRGAPLPFPIAPALDRRGVVTVARQGDDTCWLIVWFLLAYASFMCSPGCACIV
jgi:hypothetical protein